MADGGTSGRAGSPVTRSPCGLWIWYASKLTALNLWRRCGFSMIGVTGHRGGRQNVGICYRSCKRNLYGRSPDARDECPSCIRQRVFLHEIRNRSPKRWPYVSQELIRVLPVVPTWHVAAQVISRYVARARQRTQTPSGPSKVNCLPKFPPTHLDNSIGLRSNFFRRLDLHRRCGFRCFKPCMR